MSIVATKKRLAQLVQIALEEIGVVAKIITSGFDEDNANKPQQSRQVVVKHIGDSGSLMTSSSPQTKRNIQRFNIDVTVKDLRSDDRIQIIIDAIRNGLLGSMFYGIPINKIETSNEGVENGIWKYQLILDVIESDSQLTEEDCKLTNITEFEFAVQMSPSYEV